MIRALLARLRDFLWGGQTTVIPTPELFPTLDLAAVRKQLSVREKGLSNGSQNLPPAESEDPDHVEREIASFFQERLGQSAGLLEQHQAHIETSIAFLRPDASAAQLKAIAASAALDLTTLGRNSLNLLHSQIARARSLAVDLQRFRSKHRLERQPIYPDSRVFAFSVIAFVWFAETAINGNMFARGAEAGLVGGVFQAALFSGANVLLGWSIGRVGLPNVHHTNRLRSVAGALGSMALTISAGVVALMLSHYRDALAEPRDDAMALALETFRSQPFGLADIGSVVLIVLSMACCAVAAYHAYRIDDAFPGYGPLYRAAEQAHADYSNQLVEVSAIAQERRDTALRGLDLALKEAQLNHQQQQSLVSKLSALRQRFEHHQKYLEGLMQVLINEYRAANRSSRSAMPPQYFEREVRLNHIPLRDLQVAPGSDLDSIAKSFREASKAINQAYAETMRAFETVDQLTAGEVV